MLREQLVSNEFHVFGASVVLENDNVLISQGFLDSAELVFVPFTLLLRRLGRAAAVQRHEGTERRYEKKCDD